MTISEYSKYYQEIESLCEDGNFAYTGTFDPVNISKICMHVESLSGSKSGIRSDLFKVFVEMSQNISQNSVDKKIVNNTEFGIGVVLILSKDDCFEILTGNPVRPEDVKKLTEKCDYINLLTREELREFKRTSRKLAQSRAGNGNVGLIQVALISGYEMKYKMISIEEYNHFFSIRIRISKAERQKKTLDE